MEKCDFWNALCHGKNVIQSLIGGAIRAALEGLADATVNAASKVIGSLGTLWVNVGTPNLTQGGSSSLTAGTSPPKAENITQVMGYVMWIAGAVAVLSLILLGARLALLLRAGEGIRAAGRIGVILAGVTLVSGAAAVMSALIPSGPTGVGGATLFVQSSLWWIMIAASIVSVMIGGARMAWEQRAEPGKDLLRSVLTLVIVAGAGVTIMSLLIESSDAFSVWIINESLKCDVAADSACFGKNMTTLLGLTAIASAVSGLGLIMVILMAFLAIFASMIQIILMVARAGLLVVLAGILPLSASFTNTASGSAWFKKAIAWIVALLLYKPAAAIIYAAAFQLLGSNVFRDEGNGLITMLSGLMLMVMALLALPALMRFVTPMVGAMAGGSVGGAVGSTLAMMAAPTGAAAVGRLMGGRSSTTAPPPNASASGAGNGGTTRAGSTASSKPTGGSPAKKRERPPTGVGATPSADGSRAATISQGTAAAVQHAAASGSREEKKPHDNR